MLPPPPPALTHQETVARAGHYRWAELRLFEVLGGWVPSVPEPEVKICLAAHARHHAWHAELWHDLLPPPGGVDPEQLTRPAHDHLVSFVTALHEEAATVERLVGVYRVALPRLVGAYTEHLRRASPVADGPTARTLRLVLADELEDWREGELLLEELLRDDEVVRRAAHRQGELESILVGGGQDEQEGAFLPSN